MRRLSREAQAIERNIASVHVLSCRGARIWFIIVGASTIHTPFENSSELNTFFCFFSLDLAQMSVKRRRRYSKSCPVPRKTKMLHYSSNSAVTTPTYTRCFCPRDQTQALTREQRCVPAVHPRPAAVFSSSLSLLESSLRVLQDSPYLTYSFF